MTLAWLFPLGAIGLLALGAIVVLHMRHRMPGLVRFPQLAFWPRVPSESRESPRWRKPPVSLLLILQLLAALALALAFMRPAMPNVGGFIGQRADAVQHVIVLDGSTSMLARDGEGRRRWDVARNEALTALNTWQQGDGVTVVVAGGNPTWRRAVDGARVDDLRAWLAQLPVPGGTPDGQALSALINGTLLPDLAPTITLITDGGLSARDTGAGIDVVQVGVPASTAGNIAIVETVATGTGDGGERVVQATVLHDRAATETLPWVARSADADIATGTITLGSGATGTFDVRIPDGLDAVTISMVVDDALPGDNQAIVSFDGDAMTGLSIVLVSDLPGPVQRVLEVLPGARVEVYPSTTPGIREVAAGADLVVYDGSAPSPDDMPEAPMLLVQPTGFEDAWQVGGVAPDPDIGDVRLDDPVMRDVSLEGVVFGETPVYVLPPGADVIASATDAGSTLPLIWRGMVNDQPYIGFAVDPARSNLGDRVTFPVLVAQVVEELAGEGGGNTALPGETVNLDVPGRARAVELIDPEGRRSSIELPGSEDGSQSASLPVHAVPGRWTIEVLDASDTRIGGGAIAVNVGDRAESNLSGAEVVDVAVTGSDGGSGEQASGEGDLLVELWPLLVLTGIAVILLEWWTWLGRSMGWRGTSGGARL